MGGMTGQIPLVALHLAQASAIGPGPYLYVDRTHAATVDAGPPLPIHGTAEKVANEGDYFHRDYVVACLDGVAAQMDAHEAAFPDDVAVRRAARELRTMADFFRTRTV